MEQTGMKDGEKKKEFARRITSQDTLVLAFLMMILVIQN
jgi:hypothetical protein